ncbi:DNA repair protein RecN [Ructibacterium gallinarum]|uniref:DNA repair protein RecN n=1 Tax=Ructibacterium gallinarum TaxID=2779355 RepID=A0A9D5LYK8_9FIRM|nr:DNA repair protein RecN [Ructibacterium gallinarum]MBE5038895.1 DNA repair protein RecN [Ructibacterium gallinarum]
MLRELHIKNIAVIEEVTVSFGDGFHVLTGETGAGKSILIDSINMALGERSAKDLIRTGAEKAEVDVVFEPSPAAAEKLLELGIETEDDLLYISRQIGVDGKSKCRINGHLVPLSVLREASACLLTIHGQNDNQSILSPKTHIHFVDDYGNYDALLQEYGKQYQKVSEINRKLTKLLVDETERLRKIDLLSYQVNEIRAAQLKSDEEEELEERRSYLAHIEQIAENTESAYAALYGDESQAAAYDQIGAAVRDLESVVSYDTRIAGFHEILTSVLAELEDVTHDLKSYAEDIDYQPGELNQVEERLEVYATLKRKYGGSAEAVLKYCEEAQAELDEIENSDAARESLRAELEKEQKVLHEKGLALSAAREEAAISLQTRIMEELSDLDMQKMRFSVCVQPLENADGTIRYTPLGCDHVEFLISANPGEELKPLQKIASGGEMSRIMLAIKSVLADSDIVETLIFDEIDTGVSGRAAQKIAEKIGMLARSHQILCITHLAQIASMADVHFLIEKSSDDTHTRTTVTMLDEEERKTELARIIGGVKITDLTLQAAQEMLDMAAVLKERR